MTRPQSLSLFFPMHDEEDNAERAVARALEVLPGLVETYEVICVDDGSRDRTGEICDRLAAEHDAVRVVHHAENRGYGAAVKSGLAAARHELIFYTDGDLQFELDELGPFLDRLAEADVVVGYRADRRDALHRRLNGWLWSKLVRLTLGISYRDVDCAFKLIPRRLVEAIGPLETDGAMLSAELLVRLERAGARVLEVPVRHYPRTAGEPSGAKAHVILRAFRELARTMWRLRRL